MHCVAVMVVRDEADILAVNLAHHRSQGVTDFRIVDNGSSDGTAQVLRRLSRMYPLRWTRDDGAFHQSDAITELARDAARGGADWILPVDADEFWTAAPHRLVDELRHTDAGALEVGVVNFIQHRRVRRARPAALLTMTYRIAAPQGPPERCEELVHSGETAFVAIEYAGKWISRAAPDLTITPGNHDVMGFQGPKRRSRGIVCLHAPLRARSMMALKAAHGRRLIEAGYPSGHGWHVQRWYRLSLESGLEDEWAANSVSGGMLGRWTDEHHILPDQRLRDTVRPWVHPWSFGWTIR
jgi:hypothetical protein